jgi:pyrimidine deaminase RibD-like protein
MPDQVSLREKVTHLIDDIERVSLRAVDAAGRIGFYLLLQALELRDLYGHFKAGIPMSRDELENGQKWVEETLVRLLEERGLTLDWPIKWTPNMDRETYVLEARMNGIRKTWNLSYEALEDCPADKNVQRTIEKSLSMYFVPDAEIPRPEAFTADVSDSFVSSKETDDRKFAQLALEEARKSIPEDGRVHPKVGVVVVKDERILATAHRGEIPKSHAEFIALEKKLADVSISGSTVYTTLEPCTSRNHPKIPCANRLADRRVARVMIGMLDPDNKISGRGQRTLRKAGITTVLFPEDLMAEVEELNRDFVRDRESRDTQSVDSHTTNLDDRILEFLEAGVAPGKHPFTGSGNVLFRANEIAEALLVPKNVVADSLRNLETKGRVRRHDGTLDNSAPYWSVLRI